MAVCTNAPPRRQPGHCCWTPTQLQAANRLPNQFGPATAWALRDSQAGRAGVSAYCLKVCRKGSRRSRQMR